MDVRLRGSGEDIAWFCATIFDMVVDVGDQFFRLVEEDVHLWLRDGQGREADLRAVRAAKGAGHDRCPSRSAGEVPVAPMLEMWFDKDPAPAPPAPSTLDGAAPVVYTRDSWTPFEKPSGCTYHVFLAHSSPSFAKTVRDVLGRRGLFSWYEPTPDWAQRLEACAAVVVLVTGGSLRSEQLETQVAKALELSKPLVMVHEMGFTYGEANRPLPGCACSSTGAVLPAGYDLRLRDMLPFSRHSHQQDHLVKDVAARRAMRPARERATPPGAGVGREAGHFGRDRFDEEVAARLGARAGEAREQRDGAAAKWTARTPSSPGWRAGRRVTGRRLKKDIGEVKQKVEALSEVALDLVVRSDRTEEMLQGMSDRQVRMMQRMDEGLERMQEKLEKSAGALRSLRQLVINIGKSDIPIYFIFAPDPLELKKGSYFKTLVKRVKKKIKRKNTSACTCATRAGFAPWGHRQVRAPPHEGIALELPGLLMKALAPLLYVISSIMKVLSAAGRLGGFPSRRGSPRRFGAAEPSDGALREDHGDGKLEEAEQIITDLEASLVDDEDVEEAADPEPLLASCYDALKSCWRVPRRGLGRSRRRGSSPG